ncbi:MAG: hypothetical protein AUJ12_07955 [Alphaproteobacteria bacterium CG1_02_46_17]|nr:MAG: hypothetical protein AUJ12_07955 [Alphaproteobacteria bacterium CG1_02_46_17]
MSHPTKSVYNSLRDEDEKSLVPAPLDEKAEIENLQKRRVLFLNELRDMQQPTQEQIDFSLSMYRNILNLEASRLAELREQITKKVIDIEKNQTAIEDLLQNLDNEQDRQIMQDALAHNQALIEDENKKIKTTSRLNRLIDQQISRATTEATKKIEAAASAPPTAALSEQQEKAPENHELKQLQDKLLKEALQAQKLTSATVQQIWQNSDPHLLDNRLSVPISNAAREINARLAQGLKDETTLLLIDHRRLLMKFQSEVMAKFDCSIEDHADAEEEPDDLAAIVNYNPFNSQELEQRALYAWETARKSEPEFLNNFLIHSILDDRDEALAYRRQAQRTGADTRPVDAFLKKTGQATQLAHQRIVDAGLTPRSRSVIDDMFEEKTLDDSSEEISMPQKTIVEKVGIFFSGLKKQFSEAAKNTMAALTPRVPSGFATGAVASMASVAAISLSMMFNTGASQTESPVQKIDAPTTTSSIAKNAAAPKMHGDYTLEEAQNILKASVVQPESKASRQIAPKQQADTSQPVSVSFKAKTNPEQKPIVSVSTEQTRFSSQTYEAACNEVHANNSAAAKTCYKIAMDTPREFL